MLSALYKPAAETGRAWGLCHNAQLQHLRKSLSNKTQIHLQGRQALTSHLSSCHHLCLPSCFSPKSATLLHSQCVPPSVKLRSIPGSHPCALSSALSALSAPLPPSTFSTLRPLFLTASFSLLSYISSPLSNVCWRNSC